MTWVYSHSQAMICHHSGAPKDNHVLKHAATVCACLASSANQSCFNEAYVEFTMCFLVSLEILNNIGLRSAKRHPPDYLYGACQAILTRHAYLLETPQRAWRGRIFGHCLRWRKGPDSCVGAKAAATVPTEGIGHTWAEAVR